MIPTLFAYLPKEAAEALCKMAEGEPVVQPSHADRFREALAMGLGTLAGGGAAHYANEGYKKLTGRPEGIPVPHLMIAAPVVGAGLGLAYNLAKAHQLEEAKRAVQNSDHEPERRVPRG
jgi:hypothetical protein